ncbi:hypothetical protein ZWY2020_027637 [Hordeum vulgare]|nr:hypothetical protein ZWY2020_027637 [Hordeum vulgare]
MAIGPEGRDLAGDGVGVGFPFVSFAASVFLPGPAGPRGGVHRSSRFREPAHARAKSRISPAAPDALFLLWCDTGGSRRPCYVFAAASRRRCQEMGLWMLLEGFLLLANSLAILNEDRFLGPRGWSMPEVSGNGQTKSLKGQIVGLIYATQFLRMPLIALNILIIVVKLVSG